MITSIRELRAATKQIMSAVNRGDTILITNRGKACAKIVPLTEKQKEHGQDPLFGIWKSNREARSVRGYIRSLRNNRYAR